VLDRPLADLLDAATREWGMRLMLADLDAGLIERSAKELLNHAQELGIENARGLVGRSGEIVQHVAGAQSLSRLASGVDARRIHIARNVLHSLIGAGCLSQGECPISAFGVVPLVGTRDAREGRPLADDEMLAARTVVQGAVDKGGRRLKAAASFSLAELAMTSGEASHTTPDHFDSPRIPNHVEALGAGHLAKPRTLDVTTHPGGVLARVNDRMLRRSGGGGFPIAYGGGEPGGTGKASASVSGSIKRVLTDAGLNDRGITAGSVRAWRIVKVLDGGKVKAALEVSGCCDAVSMCALAGQDLNELVAPRLILAGY
jgi:hypothetical protein